jgi:signal transduction histidine kinase
VRRIDPAIDPHLAALLPDARGVVVIPLFFEGGRPLGVVALEHGGGSAGLRRWVVSMAAQFATHGALALHNAWLLEDRAGQLRTISRLDRQLRAQNAELEEMVAERTTELRQVIEDLRETDRQRRRLLEHVVHVAEEERRRIANDIHDDPVQKMVALKMRLELLAKSRRDVPELERIFRDVTETIRSLRNLLFDLRPPILDEEGIAAAIRYFLENAEVPFRWSVVDGLDVEPPAGVRLILYRIAQEALVNARKHADADTVRVTIAERDGGVWMEVADDGVGFTPQDPAAAAGHMGLAAMRERAEVAGGRCALRSLPNAGTTLEVWLPSDTPTTTVPTSGEPAEPTADVVTLRVDRIA